MSDANLYTNTARFYDLGLAGDRHALDEVGFLIRRALPVRGPILELGCGTGRVTIPLAHAGHEVWGLDLSAVMLQRLRGKLDTLPSRVRKRIHVRHGNMADFSLEPHFDLIAIPYRSFSMLTSDGARRSCLNRVRAHLAENGQFVLALHQHPPSPEKWIGQEHDQWEKTDPETGNHIRKTAKILQVDRKRQVIRVKYRFYVTAPNGDRSKYEDDFALAALTADQVTALLEDAKLKVEQAMGYFDGRPVNEGSELIFVCRR